MVLARELAVRLLDLLLGRGLRDAERLVVVLEFHMRTSRLPSRIARRMRAVTVRPSRRCARSPAPCVAARRAARSSRTSGRSRCTASAIASSRWTPARFTPASSTRCLISRSRSSSSLRVDAHAADRPRRPHQPEPLVLAQRLRVHVEQPRGHADKVEIVFDRHTFVSF